MLAPSSLSSDAVVSCSHRSTKRRTSSRVARVAARDRPCPGSVLGVSDPPAVARGRCLAARKLVVSPPSGRRASVPPSAEDCASRRRALQMCDQAQTSLRLVGSSSLALRRWRFHTCVHSTSLDGRPLASRRIRGRSVFHHRARLDHQLCEASNATTLAVSMRSTPRRRVKATAAVQSASASDSVSCTSAFRKRLSACSCTANRLSYDDASASERSY